ncbi:MAG: RNA polymerase sigma-70 factor [Bacteroidales bacterium]|nr:RNA polymerase sigma-70 factor [Bacteroidales bacterium]
MNDINKLWEGIRNGDERCFEALFREAYDSLFCYACYITDDYHLSEEIVEDVFLRIWEYRNKIKINESLKSYLYKSVHNQAINVLIHGKSKKNLVNMLLSDEQWKNLIEILNVGDDIIGRIESRETENKIRYIVDNLPVECRRIFILSRYENKSNNQIARELGISVNTVRVQIFRALEVIREKIF